MLHQYSGFMQWIKPNQRGLMHQITLKACTSTTLTFVWSSRRAFRAKEGTVICLSLFHMEGEKEKKSDSLKENLPLRTRTLAWHFITGAWFFFLVNSPLNFPWLSSALRGLDTLDRTKNNMKSDIYMHLHTGIQKSWNRLLFIIVFVSPKHKDLQFTII